MIKEISKIVLRSELQEFYDETLLKERIISHENILSTTYNISEIVQHTDEYWNIIVRFFITV